MATASTSTSATTSTGLLLLLLLLSTGASTAMARRSPPHRPHRHPPHRPHRPPPPQISPPPPPPPQISWATNITLLGDASFKNNSISLTRGTPGSVGSVGRALRPVRFRHPTTGNPASFSTSFSFSITPSSFPMFGDGHAFLITSDPKSLGSPDGYMGLFPNNSATSRPTPRKRRLRSRDRVATIAVEFDTNHDSVLRDYNDNHVALDVNRMVSTAYASAWDSMVDLKGGAPMTAWVEYNSSESKLQAWLSYSRNRPPHPLLIGNVDLSVHFREFMHVGFSASDRWDGAALHLVTGWSFRTVGFSTPSPPCQTCSSNQDDDEDPVDKGRSAAAAKRSGAATKGSRPPVYITGGDLVVSAEPPVDVSRAAARPNKPSRRNMVVGLGAAGAFVALFLVMARMVANSLLKI